MMTKSRSRDKDAFFGYIYVWISMTIVICALLFIIINVALDGFSVISWEFLTSEPSASARNIKAAGY